MARYQKPRIFPFHDAHVRSREVTRVHESSRKKETPQFARDVAGLIRGLGRRASTDPVELGRFAEIRRVLDEAERYAVEQLRADDVSWATIGLYTGMTKQSAQERHAKMNRARS